MTKKITTALVVLSLVSFFSIFSTTPVSAQEPLVLEWFLSDTCRFCKQQKIFLEELKERYPELEIRGYSVTEEENLVIRDDLISRHKGSERFRGAVPLTFISGEFFAGFSEETERKIEALVSAHYAGIKDQGIKTEETFTIPFLGEVALNTLPLFVLAPVMGLIDGFNVCSLAALMLILTLVLPLKSRKLTLILGGVFILTTGIIYGTLILFWHQLFSLLVPYMQIMQIFIALISSIAGIYFIKQFFKTRKQAVVCEVGKVGIVQRATQKVERLFREYKSIWHLFGGVALFASIITIIEFPCSAVIPLIFTGVLATAETPFLTSLFYISIYLLFYMIDEIIIFLVAVITRKLWMSSNKIMPYINLAGAAVMFYLVYHYLLVL